MRLFPVLLLAAASAHAQPWQGTVGVGSAQVERGLDYIDRPFAEASLYRYAESGWYVGASAAHAFRGAQKSHGVSAGGSWQWTPALEVQASLAHRDYRMANDFRYRYEDANLTVNLYNRLFLSADRLFHARSRQPYRQSDVPGTLAKEAVWRQPLGAGWTLLAGVGHAAQYGAVRNAYWYGSALLRTSVGPASVEGGWIGMERGGPPWYGQRDRQRLVATARWQFF